jgi:CheY-like chemotaxis protein
MNRKNARPRAERILIIDDEPLVGRFVGSVLRTAGFEVDFSPNPVDGLNRAIELRPDLIITDYEMSEFSGAELCVQLKSRPETKDVPVVLVSGKPGFYGEEVAEFTGADAYFDKPIASSRLVSTVRRLLATSDSRRVCGAP